MGCVMSFIKDDMADQFLLGHDSVHVAKVFIGRSITHKNPFIHMVVQICSLFALALTQDSATKYL